MSVSRSVTATDAIMLIHPSSLGRVGWMDGWMNATPAHARRAEHLLARTVSASSAAMRCPAWTDPVHMCTSYVLLHSTRAPRRVKSRSSRSATLVILLGCHDDDGMETGARDQGRRHTHTHRHILRAYIRVHTHTYTTAAAALANCIQLVNLCRRQRNHGAPSVPSHHLPTGGDAESTHAPRTSWTAPAQYVPTHVLRTTSRRASCVFRTVTLATLSQSTAAPVSRPSLHHSVSSHLGGTAQQHAPGQTFTPPRSPPRLPPDAAPCAWALYQPATWFLATSSARRGRHDASQPAPASVGLFGASTPGFASPSSRRVRAAVPPTPHIRTS
ncbi:hypothetical protein PCL_02924 [Purpureocillium lilacinum]|uniref:Uncharacterized protein n=1 Tax=Purpureocillium lilacinum TaxID=33203 RepID=A0A2U3DZ85_PURLI|nr:hypothetical protein PCL_02924 [Purpureocillium lilacinum]